MPGFIFCFSNVYSNFRIHATTAAIPAGSFPTIYKNKDTVRIAAALILLPPGMALITGIAIKNIIPDFIMLIRKR